MPYIYTKDTEKGHGNDEKRLKRQKGNNDFNRRSEMRVYLACMFHGGL